LFAESFDSSGYGRVFFVAGPDAFDADVVEQRVVLKEGGELLALPEASGACRSPPQAM
jgi:hypothetical protein